MPAHEKELIRKPPWLRKFYKDGGEVHLMKHGLRERSLHTVCESAKCPNIGECFGRGTAAFLIMGSVCTRNCRFCAVRHGQPAPLNHDEPNRIADMVGRLGLKHVVITSVTRDDLGDGGASHFNETIHEIRRLENTARKKITIEVLTPDFNGNKKSIKAVLDAKPNIFNHNVETVERLTKEIRSGADYDRSLSVLKYASDYSGNILTKSGIMVGLGETDEEICETLDDLASAGCSMVTIGQYLRPGVGHYPVKRYVEPKSFKYYKEYGESAGIRYVFSGPFVRSSYMAGEILPEVRK